MIIRTVRGINVILSWSECYCETEICYLSRDTERDSWKRFAEKFDVFLDRSLRRNRGIIILLLSIVNVRAKSVFLTIVNYEIMK